MSGFLAWKKAKFEEAEAVLEAIEARGYTPDAYTITYFCHCARLTGGMRQACSWRAGDVLTRPPGWSLPNVSMRFSGHGRFSGTYE